MAIKLTPRPDAIAFTIISESGAPVYVFVALRLKHGKAYHLYTFKRFLNSADAAQFVQSHGDMPDVHIYYKPGELPFKRVPKGGRHGDDL